MNKIVVTGATSMIGIALIEVAVKNGTEVFAIVRPDTKRMDRIVVSPLVHCIEGDLDNLMAVKGIPSDCDVFYHFAWAGTSKAERDNVITQEENIRYAYDAVELARRCGCKKFIGAGSQAEYGPTVGVIDENTRFAPITAYGICKLAAGILSRKKCEQHDITHIWGRIFSVYGPHDNEGTMLNYAINQFDVGKEAKFSAATQMWNYLFESDAGMIFYLMGEKINKNAVYRVANRQSYPLREYILSVAKLMKSEQLCYFAKPSESDITYGIETCDACLFDEISYEPEVDFTEGIKFMLKKRKEQNEKD